MYIISIHGEITDTTVRMVHRGFARALDGNISVVVLDMDTNGGLVSSLIEIARTVGESPFRTVAWLHNESVGGGTLISLACDEIVTSHFGKMGDCTPTLIYPEESLDDREKSCLAQATSYIIAEFRECARANGYCITLCEAMVKPGPAIYQIRNVDSEAVRYVHADELPDYGLAFEAVDVPDGFSSEETATSDAQSAITVTLPGPEIAAGEWEKVKRVLRKDELLLLPGREAIECGLAKQYVNSDAELAGYLNVPEKNIIRMETFGPEERLSLLISATTRAAFAVVPPSPLLFCVAPVSRF